MPASSELACVTLTLGEQVMSLASAVVRWSLLPPGLTSSNIGGDVRGGQTRRRVGHVSTRVCPEEGKCHVVENFHGEQSELNDDSGLCNCWGSKVTAS